MHFAKIWNLLPNWDSIENRDLVVYKEKYVSPVFVVAGGFFLVGPNPNFLL